MKIENTIQIIKAIIDDSSDQEERKILARALDELTEINIASLPEVLPEEIRRAVSPQGVFSKVQAIKAYRQRTKSSIRQAMIMVNRAIRESK